MPKRFRLTTLLVVAPLLVLVVALGWWAQALQERIAELELRIDVIEATPLVTMSGATPGSPVLLDVDRAMQMESMTRQGY